MRLMLWWNVYEKDERSLGASDEADLHNTVQFEEDRLNVEYWVGSAYVWQIELAIAGWVLPTWHSASCVSKAPL